VAEDSRYDKSNQYAMCLVWFSTVSRQLGWRPYKSIFPSEPTVI